MCQLQDGYFSHWFTLNFGTNLVENIETHVLIKMSSGNGCGSVDRAVVSDTRGKDENKEKKWREWPNKNKMLLIFTDL